VSARILGMFALAVALQVVMVYLLPMTRGYRTLLPTIGCLLSINAAIFCLARLSASGVSVGILIPVSAALVPLAAIAIATLAYGEPAPLYKVTLLICACGLIGFASSLSR
jgi:quaternary ammonium compound-resistance protein SugE